MKGLSVSALTFPLMSLIHCFPSRKRVGLFTVSSVKGADCRMSSVWYRRAALIAKFILQSQQTSLPCSLSCCVCFYTWYIDILVIPFHFLFWHESSSLVCVTRVGDQLKIDSSRKIHDTDYHKVIKLGINKPMWGCMQTSIIISIFAWFYCDTRQV